MAGNECAKRTPYKQVSVTNAYPNWSTTLSSLSHQSPVIMPLDQAQRVPETTDTSDVNQQEAQEAQDAVPEREDANAYINIKVSPLRRPVQHGAGVAQQDGT